MDPSAGRSVEYKESLIGKSHNPPLYWLGMGIHLSKKSRENTSRDKRNFASHGNGQSCTPISSWNSYDNSRNSDFLFFRPDKSKRRRSVSSDSLFRYSLSPFDDFYISFVSSKLTSISSSSHKWTIPKTPFHRFLSRDHSRL